MVWVILFLCSIASFFIHALLFIWMGFVINFIFMCTNAVYIAWVMSKLPATKEIYNEGSE